MGVGNYCYVAVCSAALGAQREERGGGISWQPPAYSLVSSTNNGQFSASSRYLRAIKLAALLGSF